MVGYDQIDLNFHRNADRTQIEALSQMLRNREPEMQMKLLEMKGSGNPN